MPAIRLLKNTDRYLIVHKEPGIAFHADRTDPEEYEQKQNPGAPGVIQIIREMESAGEIPGGPRLYPVHRLDRITSGILVFARGRQNANLLGNEFRHGRVSKIYVALSDRTPKKKQGKIAGDMERGRGGAWILNRETTKPAITRFFSFGVPGRRPGLRLFLLQPKTGRTHQLRVAMKSLGAPVLGDGLYSRYDLARAEDRAYLHACAIRFQLGDETVQIYDPPAPGIEFDTREFRTAFQAIGDPFALFEKFEARDGAHGPAPGSAARSVRSAARPGKKKGGKRSSPRRRRQ